MAAGERAGTVLHTIDRNTHLIPDGTGVDLDRPILPASASRAELQLSGSPACRSHSRSTSLAPVRFDPVPVAEHLGARRSLLPGRRAGGSVTVAGPRNTPSPMERIGAGLDGLLQVVTQVHQLRHVSDAEILGLRELALMMNEPTTSYGSQPLTRAREHGRTSKEPATGP